jgi:hypothetical protein
MKQGVKIIATAGAIAGGAGALAVMMAAAASPPHGGADAVNARHAQAMLDERHVRQRGLLG